MKLRYDYKKVKAAFSGHPAIIRSIIPIELAAKNKERIRTEGLIDSGADMCMFDWEIAEALGLRKSEALSKDKFFGVTGGSAACYYFDVFLIIGGSSKNIIRCGFTEGIPDVAHGFLGQSGFFSNYRIEFHHAKEKIKIWDGK